MSSAIDGESSMVKLMDIREKKSIKREKKNMGNQMQMIRVGEGALGVGQTESAVTPSSETRHQDTCPASSDFGLL